MSSSETLLQATLNRLSARFGQKLVDSAAKLAAITQDAPQQIKEEWQLFQEEVYAEAERLNKQSNEKEYENDTKSHDLTNSNPQEKIDLLRAKVAKLNRQVERKS